nr:hypothetical protein [Pelagibacterales bacterium]
MRKEILITNYRPEKLKEAREISGLTYDYFDDDDAVDIEKLELYENERNITPIDIFLLAYLYVLYKDKSKENGVNKFLSLTSDLLFPHPNGIKYQEFIVSHPNYKAISYKRKKNGNISWVSVEGSDIWSNRLNFWEQKRIEFGIKAKSVRDSGIRQKVAFANHPTKKHICLYSGTELFIDYRYPSPSRIKMLNNEYDENFKFYDLDIYQIIHILFKVDKCNLFVKIFKIYKSFSDVKELIEIVKVDYVEKEYSPFVSPGTMANPP